MENATEEYIEGLYYHRMYFSPGCWKDDHRYVTRELRKLTSESAKYHALKENIMIRVKGFGWEWCRHQWSKDGRKYTVEELANHLRHIINGAKCPSTSKYANTGHTYRMCKRVRPEVYD